MDYNLEGCQEFQSKWGEGVGVVIAKLGNVIGGADFGAGSGRCLPWDV